MLLLCAIVRSVICMGVITLLAECSARRVNDSPVEAIPLMDKYGTVV
jgi:coenzyme F420-reducing hydrogenase gamma subunit